MRSGAREVRRTSASRRHRIEPHESPGITIPGLLYWCELCNPRSTVSPPLPRRGFVLHTGAVAAHSRTFLHIPAHSRRFVCVRYRDALMRPIPIPFRPIAPPLRPTPARPFVGPRRRDEGLRRSGIFGNSGNPESPATSSSHAIIRLSKNHLVLRAGRRGVRSQSGSIKAQRTAQESGARGERRYGGDREWARRRQEPKSCRTRETERETRSNAS
jgi:hypothetical protein